MRDLTLVSLAGAALYCVAVLFALIAAHKARDAKRPTSDWLNWLFVAAMFVVFAALRGLQIEDWIEATLRQFLRSEGVYRDRRSFQEILAIGLAALAILGFGYWIYRGSTRLADRCAALAFCAQVACIAMVGLIGLRLVSLHAIDLVLYRLKVNWIADIGLTLFVIVAAALYASHAAKTPAKGARRSETGARRERNGPVRRPRRSRR